MKKGILAVFFIVLAISFIAYSAEEKKAMAKPKGKMMSKEAKIKNAMSAAPMSIAKDATIMDFPEAEGGAMATLREGTNGWTCLPNDPSTPANDPMCLDKMGWAWGGAWMSHQDPNIASDGLG